MADTKLKFIAYYLPQFYETEENNKWWGKGFTEWTNTKSALQLFEGHVQPHVPHKDLGYYDLSDISVMINQAKMAKEYGIHGFCYYYYWFDGRRILEKPVERMLLTPEVEIPFCLCWANHHWSRNWDGRKHEILIEQSYDEQLYSKFIDDLYPYFNDPRYIRIDGKPLFLVYQADDLPNPGYAVNFWRKYAKEKYSLDLYLVCVQQSVNINPKRYGYDAALKNSPFWNESAVITRKNYPKPLLEHTSMFFDDDQITYNDVIRKEPNYKLFSCVYPMWDNSARKKTKSANIILNTGPDNFKTKLLQASRRAVDIFDESERIIFINAWNEWAESAYIEPSEKYGYAFLEICKELQNMPFRELKSRTLSAKGRHILTKKLEYASFEEKNLLECQGLLGSFDFVVGIGEDHSIGRFLKNLNLQLSESPFDALSNQLFESSVDLIYNNFKSFLNKDLFKKIDDIGMNNNSTNYVTYEHIEYKSRFCNDFNGDDFNDQFGLFQDKYKNIINVFENNLNKSKSICFVWLSKDHHVEEASLYRGYKKLTEKFPDKKIFLCVLEYEDVEAYRILFKKLDNSIFIYRYDNYIGHDHASIDYSNSSMTGYLLSTIFTQKTGVENNPAAHIAPIISSAKKGLIYRFCRRIFCLIVPNTNNRYDRIKKRLKQLKNANFLKIKSFVLKIMMSFIVRCKFFTIYKKLKDFKRIRLEKRIKICDDENEKLNIITCLASYLVNASFTRLNSKLIEDELSAIANNHGIELHENFCPNSILHVMTACYIFGGHTQVVRRWVENGEAGQRHSVIFTSQPNPELDTPQTLIDAVNEKKGSLFFQDKSKTFLERALELRQIASSYDKIVLHSHMDDVIPMLAFSHTDFKRPIIFFNHADHLFWLGVSISDVVVHFRTWAKTIAEKFRGIDRNATVNLPIVFQKESKSMPKTIDIKTELGFGGSSKVVISMASAFKYKPFDGIDFVEMAKLIIHENPDTVFLVIGPDMFDDYWKKAYETSHGKIKAIGYVSSDIVEKYLRIADLAIDSLPVSSFLSLLDIAKYDIPVLTLCTPINMLDCLIKADSYSNSVAELVAKASNILQNCNNNNYLYDILRDEHSNQFFRQQINNIFSLLPNNHSVYSFLDDDRYKMLDMEIFLAKNKYYNIS